ncbi:MAG: hypothetical protein V2I26_12505 [Halieaceae bacterium]|jgi:hypothetical protein|nr:hypothetical protein [Halieaceae bacterium]
MKYSLLCAVLLASAAVLAQDGTTFPGVEELMTPEEYRAAGLEKLTPAERQALNSFLIRYTAEDSVMLFNTDEEVKKAAQEQEIVSVIQQPFKGWSGDTVFRLENGQVWQQRQRGNYPYRGTRPEVRITKNFMGFYRMELTENGKAVAVKRLK